MQKSSVLNLAFAISLRPAMSSSFFFFLLQFSFSLLLHITETFGLMEQLANLAMRQ